MDASSRQWYMDEFSFFGKINAISGILKPIGEGQDRAAQDEARKEKIKSELLKIGTPPPNVYLPTTPQVKVLGIVHDSGIPLQSAAKVPIMVTFPITTQETSNSPDNVTSKNVFGFRRNIRIMRKKRGRDPKKNSTTDAQVTLQACIFKVGDDCRQDQLALQMIRCFRNAFETVGLDLYVYPYNVVSTKPGCGVIEVVPKTKSLDQLGKSQENFLYDYFIKTYGTEDQLSFQEARRNFVNSMAAYAITSYLLQIKDRHNGNILLDDVGHVVHIDFGFIFEISPGRDMKFEMAPFKLTGEMIHVMGDLQSNTYQYFRSQCVKGYLAVRHRMNEVLAIAGAMADSGLLCFKTGAMANLRSRFRPNLSERQAAEHIKDLVLKSESHITTNLYDWVQNKQQGITY
eukprot:c7072_g1_i1.p1 GENE.c7072_g1_i1~~c7072_g1_i1.p1  ORF type:complete len:431 (+),score=81.45 c7072_g1_i1:92-1294(+)